MQNKTVFNKFSKIRNAFKTIGFEFNKISFITSEKKFYIGKSFTFDLTLKEVNKIIKDLKKGLK